MPPFEETFDISTHRGAEIVNITQHVTEVVKKSGVKSGHVTVFSPHTTTAVTINEGEPRLIADILRKMAEIVPKGEGYGHDSIDSNAHAHILAAIIGCSVTIPVIKGLPSLGTWQSILFIELDGPRSRRLIVQVG